MKLKNVLLASALMVASASASAAEFWTYIPGDGSLKNNNASASGFSSISLTYNSQTKDHKAGQFDGNFWKQPPASAPADSFFRFFCAQLGSLTNSTTATYFASSLVSDELAKLYDLFYPNKSAGDFWNGATTTNFGVFAAADEAAAFQVAAWEILLETTSPLSLDLATGNFKWSGLGSNVIETRAQQMLDAVAAYGVGTGYTRWSLFYFQNPSPNCTAGAACGNYQDYFSAIYRAPEPGTLALLGLGLLGLGTASRRKRS